MPLEKKTPIWGAPGEEPPRYKQEGGWLINERVPAAWLNWFFNRASEALTELYAKAALAEDTGDKKNLTTQVKTTLVDAVNELVSGIAQGNNDIGSTDELATEVKASLVAAINEIVDSIGNKNSLATDTKASLVTAINELVGIIGDVTSLSTSAKANLVAAINELASQGSIDISAHINDDGIHVTEADKTNWNSKETPDGAQAKVNAHAADTNAHTTAAKQAEWDGKAVKIEYQFTLLASGWSDTDPATQTINIPGIKSTDRPTAHLVRADDETVSDQQQEDYDKLFKITISNGSITAKCRLGQKPVSDLTICLGGVR